MTHWIIIFNRIIKTDIHYTTKSLVSSCIFYLTDLFRNTRSDWLYESLNHDSFNRSVQWHTASFWNETSDWFQNNTYTTTFYYLCRLSIHYNRTKTVSYSEYSQVFISDLLNQWFSRFDKNDSLYEWIIWIIVQSADLFENVKCCFELFLMEEQRQMKIVFKT